MTDLLSKDPRTAWAWHEYLKTKNPLSVSEQTAQQLLAAIPQGDHVEVFVEGALFSSPHDNRATEMKRSAGRLAARTLRRWIAVREDNATADILDGPAKGMMYREMPVSRHEVNWYTSLDDGSVCVFAENAATIEKLRQGVGAEILRLPAWADTPEPPSLTEEDLATVETQSRPKIPSLVTDWSAAEAYALEHMQSLGFVGARLTGGSADKGMDVIDHHAVAQVKMQGVPVGAPQVQQLRGARPDHEHHLFYSTSGYTSAARGEAAESGVALFVMDAYGQVTPQGSHAKALMQGARAAQGRPEAVVATYVDEVRERVSLALGNYGSRASAEFALEQVDEREPVYRVLGYLWTAQEKLESAPYLGEVPLQSIVNYYRHTELLAAVYCRELGYEYPGSSVLGKKLQSLDDFY